MRLLPTPVAGAFNDTEPLESWLARRDRQKKRGRNGNGIGTPLTIAVRLLPAPPGTGSATEHAERAQRPPVANRQTRLPEMIARRLAGTAASPPGPGPNPLLPTPDTGISPNGHGRRGGRPGNGHQSGSGLDAAARTLTTPAAGAPAVAWGQYEPAIRQWEAILGQPAPPPAEPRPGGRPRLAAAFAEWMMGIPGLVTGSSGLPRTAQLRIIGNGAVPHQAAAALRLLTGLAALPAAPPRTRTSTRATA